MSEEKTTGTIIFYVYLCIGDEAKCILKARKQAVKVKTQKYPMLMDALTEFFESLRNVIHERGLFYVRKQRKNEALENFYAELTTVVGRCDCANAEEINRDIIIMI